MKAEKLQQIETDTSIMPNGYESVVPILSPEEISEIQSRTEITETVEEDTFGMGSPPLVAVCDGERCFIPERNEDGEVIIYMEAQKRIAGDLLDDDFDRFLNDNERKNIPLRESVEKQVRNLLSEHYKLNGCEDNLDDKIPDLQNLSWRELQNIVKNVKELRDFYRQNK